jgi:hypothetical protein
MSHHPTGYGMINISVLGINTGKKNTVLLVKIIGNVSMNITTRGTNMNQYIINEPDVEHLWNLLKEDYPIAGGELVYRIRSHPYQSERDTCPQNKIWQHCPAAEQIRKGARDKVLDAFKEVIRLHDEDELLYPDLYNEFLVIYKSQWKQAGEHK